MIFGKRKKEDADHVWLAQCYQKVFRSPEGENVLFDLMNKFNLVNDISVKDANQAFKDIGARSVIVHIAAKCNIDIAEFNRLLRGEGGE